MLRNDSFIRLTAVSGLNLPYVGYFVSDVINNNAVKNVAIFVLKVSRVDKNISGIKGTRVIKVVHSLQRSLKLYPAAENIEVIEIDKEVINHKPAWIIDEDKIKYWAILALDAVFFPDQGWEEECFGLCEPYPETVGAKR